MTGRIRRIARVAVAAGFLSFFLAAPAQATPIVVGTVTPLGPLFRYDDAITFNPLDEELALLTINVLPNDLTLGNRLAPVDYQTLYSTVGGQGFVDFLPLLGFSFPTSGTLSGFSFVSGHGPAPTTFDALTALTFTTLSGPTTGPVGAAAVPEPATWALLAIGLGIIGGRRALRTRSRSNG